MKPNPNADLIWTVMLAVGIAALLRLTNCQP